MKDEIKKQIENEAKKRLPKLWDKLSHVTFIEGAEYGYFLAQQSCVCSSITKGWDNKEDERWDSVGSKRQSVDSELRDIVDCILKFDKEESNEVKGRYFDVIQRDLEKLILSASQNQKNEKESDAVNPIELLEWLLRKESDLSIIYGGTPELKKDYRFSGEDNDYSIDEVIELFKESKTK